MPTITLGQFIEDEMNRRQMSSREFAALVGVSYPTINKFRMYGKHDTYSNKQINDPDLEFLCKLAQACSVDLLALVAIVKPDCTSRNGGALLLASQIENLPPGKREFFDTFLGGLLLDIQKQRSEHGDSGRG